MLQRVAETIRRYRMFTSGQRVGIAVSGGADSVRLLHVMIEFAAARDLHLSVLHIDHQLRGAESTEDAAFVRGLAEHLNLPFHIHRAEIAKECPREQNHRRSARTSTCGNRVPDTRACVQCSEGDAAARSGTVTADRRKPCGSIWFTTLSRNWSLISMSLGRNSYRKSRTRRFVRPNRPIEFTIRGRFRVADDPLAEPHSGNRTLRPATCLRRPRNGNLNEMHRLFWVALLASLALAQRVEDATELLRKVQSMAESTRTWRAEVVETFQISSTDMNLQNKVRSKIAVQAPLKMSLHNSGADQTILVCDGTEAFYSGDGLSYYRSGAKVNADCTFPLSRFYKLENNPATASVVGRDHVRLADGDRDCVLVRAVWKRATGSAVRTMCIDPGSALILRDVAESEDEKTHIRMVNTTTFTSYESNPTFAPDTFRFSVPPGAVEAKPPI